MSSVKNKEVLATLGALFLIAVGLFTTYTPMPHELRYDKGDCIEFNEVEEWDRDGDRMRFLILKRGRAHYLILSFNAISDSMGSFYQHDMKFEEVLKEYHQIPCSETVESYKNGTLIN